MISKCSKTVLSLTVYYNCFSFKKMNMDTFEPQSLGHTKINMRVWKPVPKKFIGISIPAAGSGAGFFEVPYPKTPWNESTKTPLFLYVTPSSPWRSAVTLLFAAAEVVDLPCLGRDLNDKAANLESFSRETCGFHHEKYVKMERQWPGC